jgi:hypothetical protein
MKTLLIIILCYAVSLTLHILIFKKFIPKLTTKQKIITMLISIIPALLILEIIDYIKYKINQ